MSPIRLKELEPKEEGARLRRLRRLAGVSQADVSHAVGYKEGTASNISKVENGHKRLSDIAKRKAANFLAGKGDLTSDARVLYVYMVGDHDSLDQCLAEIGDDGGEELRGRDSNPQPIGIRHLELVPESVDREMVA